MKITLIKTVILNGTRTETTEQIKNNYPLNLNFNGGLTAIALEITDQLNKKGYDFKRNGENIVFSK